MIEAEAGIRPNALAVAREMIARKWPSKYRIVLVSKHPESLSQYEQKNVYILKRPAYQDSAFKKIRYRWCKLKAIMIIDENVQISKGFSGATHVYLAHGCPVNHLRSYYTVTKDTDYMLNNPLFGRRSTPISWTFPGVSWLLSAIRETTTCFPVRSI